MRSVMAGERSIRARPGRAGSGLLLLLGPGLLTLLVLSAPTVLADGHDIDLTAPLIGDEQPIAGSSLDVNGFITPAVSVRNIGTRVSPTNALIDAFLCPGEVDTCTGVGNKINFGKIAMGAIAPGNSTLVRWTNAAQPSGTGEHTMEFVSAPDADSSNNRLTYQVHIPSIYVDLVWRGSTEFSGVYNTGESLPVSVYLAVNNWRNDSLVSMGWELREENGTVVKRDMAIPVVPQNGQNVVFNLDPVVLPTLQGNFLLCTGVFTAENDPNPWNNVGCTRIVVSDAHDARIVKIRKTRGDAADFPYGMDAFEVVIQNDGHRYVDVELTVRIFSVGQTTPLEEWSNITRLDPGAGSSTFRYDLLHSGFPLTINASFGPDTADNDIRPGNNWYEVNLTAGARIDLLDEELSASFHCGRDGICDSGEGVDISVHLPPYAAQPLVVVWRYGPGIELEECSDLTVCSTSSIPHGNHLVTAVVTDAFFDPMSQMSQKGHLASASVEVDVFDRTDVSDRPAIVGEALTRTVAQGDANYSFPPIGKRYLGLPTGHSPLRRICLNVDAVQSGADIGLEWIDLTFNLTVLLPPSISREYLQLLWLDSYNGTTTSALAPQRESFLVVNNAMATATVIRTGCLILTGQLDPAHVSLDALSVNALAGGKVRLALAPSGDLLNPYFGGWRIHRRVDAPWSWPPSNFADAPGITAGTEQGIISPSQSTWVDPSRFGAGRCVSYLVVAIDREGNWDWPRWFLSHTAGDPEEACTPVDDQPSSATVVDLEAIVEYACEADEYSVELQWLWPSAGDWTGFDLYRLDRDPSDGFSLRFATPMEPGLSGEPGAAHVFVDNGSLEGSVLARHRYHYVLAPTDAVGNAQHSAQPGNTATVTVGNDYWVAGCREKLPEPEPPPFNSTWVGGLVDLAGDQTFLLMSAVLVAVLLINVIAGAPILKRIGRARRRIEQRQVHEAGIEKGPDEDIDGDLAGFFK